uniref:Uncharacterized protein n=1 Tax=Pyxicephalus adspersus TaxID=30357 RepID=A0AAV3A8Q7_PYXAD|nr:TPA: hypothetical protein GDO54_014089 [Pyxicephalus adspersus]
MAVIDSPPNSLVNVRYTNLSTDPAECDNFMKSRQKSLKAQFLFKELRPDELSGPHQVLYNGTWKLIPCFERECTRYPHAIFTPKSDSILYC